ncbi:MAG TPA: LysR substrate-binding domain-containing protein [Actinocrinis sp.]|nr:LysR substrate-binding domain-containing protein [Actinocrinis sp.]
MLDVRRLRLLRELAHRGTIAAVAEALAFTPSAVSQQLSALEREAGLPLLERTGRRVVLTPAGLNLVRHAEAVLTQLEQAAADLAGAREGLAGPLRIGTFPSAGRTMIPAALVALARQHPGLEPMVSEIDPAGVADALRAGELDVAMVHEYDFVAGRPEPGLATEPLCSESMYLASGPYGGALANSSPALSPVRSPLPAPSQVPSRSALPPQSAAGGEVIGLIRKWRDAPWITAMPGTMCQEMTVRACQVAGFTPRVRHQVDDFATMLALVAAGQGVALVPQLGVMDPPAGTVLIRVPMCRRTQIAFRSGAGAHPAVVAITAALRSAVPEELDVAGRL